MRRGGSEEQIFSINMKGHAMTSKITNTHSNQQPAGVPPAPSEAHQRAAGGMVGISCTDVAKLVRKALQIKSRSELNAAGRWFAMRAEFLLWERHG